MNSVTGPETAVLMRVEFLQLERALERRFLQDLVMRIWRTVWRTVNRKISTTRTF